MTAKKRNYYPAEKKHNFLHGRSYEISGRYKWGNICIRMLKEHFKSISNKKPFFFYYINLYDRPKCVQFVKRILYGEKKSLRPTMSLYVAFRRSIRPYTFN